jgi:uncharacterized protein with ParB-like and HNH nuclease domain
MDYADIAVLKEQYKIIFALLNEQGQRMSKIEMRLDNFLDKFTTKDEAERLERRMSEKIDNGYMALSEKIRPFSRVAWTVGSSIMSAVVAATLALILK